MAVDYAAHYYEVEKELAGLLPKLVPYLTPAELAEVTEFLAAREYALALEEIVGALADHQSLGVFGRNNRGSIELLISLARKMEIENRPLMEALERDRA